MKNPHKKVKEEKCQSRFDELVKSCGPGFGLGVQILHCWFSVFGLGVQILYCWVARFGLVNLTLWTLAIWTLYHFSNPLKLDI